MDLINRIHKGDKKAEEELIFQYIERIKITVRYRLANQEACWDDLVQDICFAVILSLRQRKYKSEKGTLGDYISGIARNKIIDYGKKSKRAIMEDISKIDPPVSPEVIERLENEEHQNIMRNALEKLKAEYKEVLVLRYYKDLAIDEIAEKLGISKQKVSDRIAYATKLLRKKCKKFFP